MEEFNDAHLLHTNFNIRSHFVRLLLCCHLVATKLTNSWREVSTSTAIPPASATNVVGQQYEIRGIIGAPLILYITVEGKKI
jgi:hypothetical protein